MRKGYGVGLKEIARQSNAPIGSMYHFFPGGKDELAAEALRTAGTAYQHLVEAVFDNADSFIEGIQAVFEGAAEVLAATDYADACPIETVALEVCSTNEPLRLVTAEIFQAWIEAATERGQQAGLSKRDARRIAFATVSALEGAFVLSRAMKSPEPLLAAGAAMVTAARAAPVRSPRSSTRAAR